MATWAVMTPSDHEDDGFGPALRGGPAAGTAAPSTRSAVDAPPRSGSAVEDGFGPAQGGRAPRVRVPATGAKERGGGRRVGRLVLRTVAGLLVLVVAGAAGLLVLATSQMNRVPVDGLGAPPPMNVLLVGSDSREGLTKAQRRALGTGDTQGARTDTILLLQVSGGQVAMLSFPRDLMVERCDGTSGRINVAYAQSRSCLAQTVTKASGIPVTHFLEVNFLGFRDIVRAVGGVEICLGKPIKDRDAHINLPAGCQRLTGKQALGYVRVRKIDDDMRRIGRQQQFLKELAAEVARPSTVLNPVRMVRTTSAVARSLTVDEGFGALDLARLGLASRDIASGDYPSLAVPAQPATVGGASVLVPAPEAEQIYAPFRNGTAPEQERKVDPGDVTVNVRNGAGVAGLAATAADALEAAGFQVGAVGNAPHVARTVIRYRQGHEAEARALAQRLPNNVPVEQVDSGGPVVLFLGEDAELP